jgi:hypothetical protein
MLSVYDRIPLQVRADRLFGQTMGGGRTDILRRGARMLDMSQAIAAGSMVILAEAPGPLPIPMTVSGETVGGEGLNFYQFVIPVDRSPLKSTTQPATQAAAVN